MNSCEFENGVEGLMEKHIPVGFVDFVFLMSLKQLIVQKDNITRRELLMMAYMLGANADETNGLLKAKNFPPLYVKRREDAVWKFALDKRMDTAAIFNEIFSQNADADTV